MSRLAQLIWLATSIACGSALAQPEIRWGRDLITARRAAAQSQVPMLIHFYGDNCLPCKTLEQRVLNQETVVNTLNKYFICVRVNASQERDTAAAYNVHTWPTDVFVSADGQLLHQGVCKQDVSGYMEVLKIVAIMNRDRNTMLATARSGQATGPNQNTSTGALPPNVAQPTNAAFAAAPAIAQSTPAAQFQVAPAVRTPLNSSEGLPPLASHMASQPLGSNGLGANSNVSGQMVAQVNMPQVSKVLQGQPAVGQTSKLVSNPYFPESEAMVCTPNGKCGPASSVAQSTSFSSAHLERNSVGPASGPAQPAPTFQPRSASFVTTAIDPNSGSQHSNEQTVGLIENPKPQATEPAAYNGFCPIALVNTGQRVQGSVANSVRHRGRTYLLENPAAVQEFLRTPDRYSPVLSGYDPMVFLESGDLVEGSLEYALHDPKSGIVILFSSAETQAKFKSDPMRNTNALSYILNAMNKK